MKRRFTAFAASAALVLSSALSLGAEQAPPLMVQTTVINDTGGQVERQFFGVIAARTTLNLSFEIGGRLEVFDAPEGSWIQAGDLVAALDDDSFSPQVERAVVALAKAERDRARAERLAQRQTATVASLEDNITAQELSDIALRDAEKALEDTKIFSPFDGIIADRIASQFEIVAAGEPILRLHDMSEVRVEFELPERISQQVGDLDAVTFSAVHPSLPRPMPLELREFRAETGPIGQSYTVSLAVLGDDLPRLFPGQAVRVKAVLETGLRGHFVPPSAVLTQPSGATYVVAVEETDGTLLARHLGVEVSSPDGSRLMVDGLPAGSEIVVAGVHAIRDGASLARYTGLNGSE